MKNTFETMNEVFGERLVRLCDGQAGLRAGLVIEIREPDPRSGTAAPILDFIASDETLDRYGEILVASGWKLDRYQQNPIFQNAHQYGDVIFTLGKALATEVRAGKLYQRIEFATDVNPLAKIAYGLYRGHFLNAVSVGFIPLRWENGSVEAGYRRKYLEQELLEVSAVCIPANPNALQLGLKAGAVEKSDLLELAELLRVMGEQQIERFGDVKDGGRILTALTESERSPLAADGTRLSNALRPGTGRGPVLEQHFPNSLLEPQPRSASERLRIPIDWLQPATAEVDLEAPPSRTDQGPWTTNDADARGSSEEFVSNRVAGEVGGDSVAAVNPAPWLQLAAVVRSILRRA